MQSTICTIFDSKAEAFLPPMFFQSRGSAIRTFSDAVNGGDAQITKHPEDYTLFLLGTFSDVDAKFDLLPTPQSLGLALEFVNK